MAARPVGQKRCRPVRSGTGHRVPGGSRRHPGHGQTARVPATRATAAAQFRRGKRATGARGLMQFACHQFTFLCRTCLAAARCWAWRRCGDGFAQCQHAGESAHQRSGCPLGIGAACCAAAKVFALQAGNGQSPFDRVENLRHPKAGFENEIRPRPAGTSMAVSRRSAKAVIRITSPKPPLAAARPARSPRFAGQRDVQNESDRHGGFAAIRPSSARLSVHPKWQRGASLDQKIAHARLVIDDQDEPVGQSSRWMAQAWWASWR